jgi:hypothetical protein
MTLIFVAAAVKLVLGLGAGLWASFALPWPSPALPGWYYVFLLLVFGLSGALLYLGARGDVRTRSLGLVFLLFGTLFADRLLVQTLPFVRGSIGLVWSAVTGIHLTALQPFAFWRFAWSFPRAQPALVPDWVPRWMNHLTLAVGGVLTLGTLALGVTGDRLPALAPLGTWLSPSEEEGWFWQTCTLLVLPSLVLLVAKWRTANAAERRRLGWIVGGIVAGSLPMVVNVVLVTTLPAWEAFVSAHSRAVGIAVSAFSLAIPATAAYAVLVAQILEVRILVRRAVQYALARYSVLGLTVALAGGLAALGYRNRHRPLAEIVGSSPWAAVALGGAAALLLFRRPLLEAIDRRFFREQYDARRILVDLVDRTQKAATAREVMALITSELDRALHLERIALLVRDDQGGRLLDPRGHLPSLDMDGALGSLIAASPAPLDVDLSSGGSPLGRLPEPDREWLADAGARLVVPLLGAQGHPVGVLALGDKKSELPFTPEDRQLLTVLVASAALALERRLQSESPYPAPDRTMRGASPASQCVACGRVQDRAQQVCSACGCSLREALVPAVLAGKFEIERQVGAGGMGVVYRAYDRELDRAVAVKVLPRIAPEATARLRREARAMAAVQHPHLAVIHSMESWRGVPALVIEYLSGGTVAGRIRQGPLPVADVLSLGLVVADVLHHVHRTGYLHRDIKPSNIGYTESGVPKLLDFGLARLTSTVNSLSEEDAPGTAGSPPEPPAGLSSAITVEVAQTAARRIVGTPAYLPPEAIALEPPAPAIDLWGLGVTLYEALTGLNPFLAATLAETASLIQRAVVPDPREHRPDCPPALAAFLLSALAANPALRPQSALEFASRLRSVARELETGTG